MKLTLTSTAFENGGSIPVKYTCHGADISPPLRWSNLPPATKSIAIIVDDPDAPDPKAPKMTWVHWLLYNIPPETDALSENMITRKLPPGTLEGTNDWKSTGYGGPCPPIGQHRYFFKLYALDTLLPDLGNPVKTVLESSMRGHIISQTDLVGTYKK